MGLITAGNVKVVPFVFESLQELRIEKNINEHATLYVKGVVKDGWKSLPVADSAERTNIKCEDGANVYFSGVLQRVAVAREDDVYCLEAWAVSHTVKLDTQRHKRAFQNDGRTYEDIVGAIISDGGGSVNYHASPLPIDKLLVQYDETDWEFAKRLASHTQDVLLSRSSSDSPELHFGAEDESCAGEIVTAHFSVLKDFNLLRSRANDDRPLSEDDITMYKVKTEDFAYGAYDAGDKVRFNGADLYVRSAEFDFENDIMTSSYTLSGKSAVTAPKAYNQNVTGLALKGVVQEVENDDIKLDLDIDYGGGASQLFKYATDYSPESHTGWYCMPEVGDTVFVVLPSENEKDAHASSSMRQSATARTGDPKTKFMRNTFGKEMKMNYQEVLFTGKDDDTFVRINETTGIEIVTSKPIVVNSDETINIHSIGETTIYSEDDMVIKTDANLIVSAGESINMSCGGNAVDIRLGTGIKATTDTEINMSSAGKTNIQSVDDMAIASNSDISISSDNNLLEMGGASIKLDNVAHSIKMETESGIDVESQTNLNMAAILSASLTGTQKLDLSSNIIVNAVSTNLSHAGKMALTETGGLGLVNLSPIGALVAGPLIFED